MRAIIFDLDDTLYPRDHFIFSGFAAVARHVEAHWDIPAGAAFARLCAASVSGKRGREFQALCVSEGIPATAVNDFIDIFQKHQPDLSLSQAATSMLQRMRADRWRLGVLTNGNPDIQRRKVEALHLAEHVDVVIYAEEHAEGGKPARAAFNAALQGVAVAPLQAVFVGDDLAADIYGARAAGLHTIRVRQKNSLPVLGDDADAVIEILDQIPSVASLLIDGVSACAA